MIEATLHPEASGRDALERTFDGQGPRHQSGSGAADLDGAGVEAALGAHLQAEQRSAVREKLRDVVGLYRNPPENAVVLCVDEKSQIQALDRTAPSLPLKRGRAGTMTHDYRRNGTTTLFAALNLLDGTVIAECMKRHRHQEFLRFLKRLDQEIPPELELHLVLDNYQTHKHPGRPALAPAQEALPLPLHSDVFVLAQPGGALARQSHHQGHPARRFPQCEGIGRGDLSLRRTQQ